MEDNGDEVDDDHAELQPWLWWNKIAKLLDYHSKVYPVLGLRRNFFSLHNDLDLS